MDDQPQKDADPTTTTHASSASQNAAVQDVVMEDASLNSASATTGAGTAAAGATSPGANVTNNGPVSAGNGTGTATNSHGAGQNSTVGKDDGSSQQPPDQQQQQQQQDHQRIVEEFQYLLDKSQQMFAGLRDLSPYGGRQWQPYFQRTFEIYTKLWRFQQQNRVILENKDNYGLKRWDVGEIASKIGQLYYHYYLRTSETNYLHESYIFYEAIRDRAYFKDVLEVKTTALMIKKLRYYARFIVVCLLLNKKDIVEKLMEELTVHVDDFTRVFKPVDAVEWQLVLREIAKFLKAEKTTVPVTPDGRPLRVPRRLQAERNPRVEKDGIAKLKLQEAIIVGNCQDQTKFSELTLDMYHILQSLEREAAPPKPSTPETSATNKEDGNSEDATNANAATDKGASRRLNPHKYLLYKPTFSQLMVYIATAFKEINDNSALLLYLSADGAKKPQSLPEDETSAAAQERFNSPLPGYSGGVATASRRQSDRDSATDSSSLINCVHPNDLVPFTRKPMFVIVDSDNSTAFADFPKTFDVPFFCIMSPTEYPPSIGSNRTQIGNLLTLFLHSPALGITFVSDVHEVLPDVWERCLGLVSEVECSIVELLYDFDPDKALRRFMTDDILRQYIVRFVLCRAVLHARSTFTNDAHYPSSSPQLPREVFASPKLLVKIREIALALNVESHYTFPPEVAENMDVVAGDEKRGSGT